MIVQKLRELLAQAFVALALMAGDDGVLEDLFLHVLGKVSPEVIDGPAQNKGETGFGIGRELVRHLSPFSG
jgi:hypothetical protein